MKKICAIMIFTMAFSLCGCGNTAKLDEYYDGMQSFCSNVQIITEQLDLIDVTRESAGSQITDQLNDLSEQFRIMSELEVPKNFSACEELGDEAYNYMTETVRLYNEWVISPDSAGTETLEMAKENYIRAMQRVNYISIVLQGGIPEGDNISTYEEEITDFNPVIDESSSDESYEEDEFYDNTVDEFAEPEDTVDTTSDNQ